MPGFDADVVVVLLGIVLVLVTLANGLYPIPLPYIDNAALLINELNPLLLPDNTDGWAAADKKSRLLYNEEDAAGLPSRPLRDPKFNGLYPIRDDGLDTDGGGDDRTPGVTALNKLFVVALPVPKPE